MNNIEKLLLKASINLNLMELLEKSKKKDLIPLHFTYAQLKNLHKWYINELTKILKEYEKEDRKRVGSSNSPLKKGDRKTPKKLR